MQRMQLARFYPIVPDIGWLERIVPLGVKIVQLRMKNAGADHITPAINDALAITRRYDCQLIVNDFWREAIACGADYIHLGQEDLAAADVAAVRKARVRFGISTHTPEELEIALATKPDYIALGPIYETKLKVMPFAPQGLARVTEWKTKTGPIPLVAIGGLTPERAPDVLAAGADSLAVITDFITASNPEAKVTEWLRLLA
jgi:thiamine-phosphate pyrophosphorylase